MKRVLRRIYEFLRGLFDREFAEKIYGGIERAVPYLRKAYEVCSVLAVLTSNRSIKGLIDAANEFGVDVVAAGNVSEGLRMIAFQVLKRSFPDAPDSAINLAIEMAVNALKAEKEKKDVPGR